jgi:hypothetical protein
MKLKPEDTPLSCKVAKGVLTISIGVNTLVFACNEHPDNVSDDGDGKVWSVDQRHGADFAIDVAQELRSEEEDGTTLVHLMLDKAILAAIENGSQFVDEVTP